MMDQFSSRGRRPRSWSSYGIWVVAGTTGVAAASFAIFRSAGLSFFVAAVMGILAAWLDGLLDTARRQMGELAVCRAHLQQGEDAAARRMFLDLAERAKVSRVRNGALTMAAWAALKEGQPERAKEALDHIRPEHQIDLYCFAAVEDALGKPKLAIEALELEVSPNCEAAMFLVDLYVLQGRFDRAVMAATARRKVLGIDNCRKIVDAAIGAWALPPAASLAGTLFQETGAPEDAGALVRALAHQRQFDEVDRTTDEIVSWMRSHGKLSEARRLLSDLSSDRTLPSGACRKLAGKLRGLDLE
jgi:hypothetical protein